MNIGEFKSVNGRMLGSIATRTIDLPRLGLREVESSNDRAPAYEILALNVGNRWVQIGALWEAIAKNSTGEVFLQGSIDDPSLAEPLPIALFGSEEEGFRIAWRRPREAEGGAIGGFGESTAGDDGAMMADDMAGGPSGDLGKDIPF
jgi:uncharacterized protein (DUF736 family)